MRQSGKTTLDLEITKLAVFLIKYTKHAKHLSKENKKLKVKLINQKIRYQKDIDLLNEEVEYLEQKIENIEDDYYSYDIEAMQASIDSGAICVPDFTSDEDFVSWLNG